MKLSTLVLTLTAALTIAASFTAPALATDARGAVGLCIDRGPACSWKRTPGGGAEIEVDGHYISCPPVGRGECVVVYRTAGGKTKVVKGGNVPKLLQAQ